MQKNIETLDSLQEKIIPLQHTTKNKRKMIIDEAVTNNYINQPFHVNGKTYKVVRKNNRPSLTKKLILSAISNYNENSEGEELQPDVIFKYISDEQNRNPKPPTYAISVKK